MNRIKFCYKYCIVIIAMIMCLDTSVHYAKASCTTKKVLILNSYHKGLSWTDQQTEGIIHTIEESNLGCSACIEYMDWKNYPTKDNLEDLKHSLKYKYAQKSIDLIVTTDDAALKFAINNRKGIFSNVPIVFSGVNEEGISSILEGRTYNVTGVVEKIDLKRTIMAALKIKPNTKNIYVLYDNTESGLSTGKLAIQEIDKINPHIKVITFDNKSIEDILKGLKRARRDSIILITTYYSDKNKKVIGFENFCRLISKNSEIPIFDLYDFGIGNGAIGGSVLSGRIEGQIAGKIAIRILHGENISKIPIYKATTAQYIFDAAQFKHFNISLNLIPKGSKVLNKPFSFFETYKKLSVIVLAIFIVLIIFIFILLFYLKKISKMKQALYNNNLLLGNLYKDLEESDKELKLQFEELKRIQKDLDISEKQYKLLFDKMLNGFIVYELIMNDENEPVDLRVINANTGVQNQINIKVEHIIGKRWGEVFRYENKNLEVYQDILVDGHSQQIETYYPAMDIWFMANAFKIDDNHFGVVFDNISEYKNAIKEIQTLNKDLEQRVIDRTMELQDAVNALEAFNYTVSHDLKSPVRAIDGYSRIILEDFGEKLEGDCIEMISNIRDICKGMIDMINKLLQYSTTSKLVVQKDEVDIEELFENIFYEQKAIYLDRDIELIIENKLPKVEVDKILLKQVICNLLSNAIKFTRDRDKSIIIVGSMIREREYVFYIKDNGVGFDMEFSAKLFGLFQRLHDSEEFEGSGIGLITVKNIIQKHGGKVWIEGQVDVGATVYFTLPF